MYVVGPLELTIGEESEIREQIAQYLVDRKHVAPIFGADFLALGTPQLHKIAKFCRIRGSTSSSSFRQVCHDTSIPIGEHWTS